MDNHFLIKDEILCLLLKDMSTKKNIIFATDDYDDLDKKISFKSNMTKNLVLDYKKYIIRPRVMRTSDEKSKRTRDKAEVFTPSWLCNLMNNQLDEEWFGRKNVFNTATNEKWTVNKKEIKIPKNKTWKDYVGLKKIEITCGEAPYLVSRYDTTTGEYINVKNRIGILDRKLRVINENAKNINEWKKWVFEAYKNTYGYEYQGDNLLIARVNMYLTFEEYLDEIWNKEPTEEDITNICKIINWNIWQMDGITYSIPRGKEKTYYEQSIFDFLNGQAEDKSDKDNEIEEPVDIKIYDWEKNKIIKFIKVKEQSIMNFDFCIGNPPYQASDNNSRLYPIIYLAGRDIADYVEMIFPNNWREPKNTNGLSLMNNDEVKKDKQIIYIQDFHNAFSGVAGAEWTNVVVWKKGYDNGLEGKQLVKDEEGNESYQKLPINPEDVDKPKEILSIVEKVEKLNEEKIIDKVSRRKPYGIESETLNKPEKYGLELKDNYFDGSVRLFGQKVGEGRTFRFIDRKKLPKESTLLDKYKLFVVKAWGNMDEKNGYLGGAYSEIICANPQDCCTEMFIEVGPFENEIEMENARKYFYTKFFRAVFYKRKLSQNTAKDTYADVPTQDFTKNSDIDWSKSIKEIDKELYKKYGLTKKEIDFIEKNIKEME